MLEGRVLGGRKIKKEPLEEEEEEEGDEQKDNGILFRIRFLYDYFCIIMKSI